MKWSYDPNFMYPSYDLLPEKYESRYEAKEWIYLSKDGKLIAKGEVVTLAQLPEEYKEPALKLLIKGI